MLLIFVLHGTAFLWAVTNNPQLRDSHEYLFAAENFEKQGDFYCFDPTLPVDMRGFTKRPPLYPLVLFTLRYQPAVILFIQMLLSLFSLIYFHRWILSISGTRNISNGVFLLFLAAWVFSVSQYIYAGLVMADLWLQSIVLWMIYLVYQAFTTDKRKYWLFLSLAIILGFLLKPVMGLLVWVFPFALLLRYFKNLRRIPLLLPVVLLPVIVFQFITVAIEKKTGYRHYSSITNINLLHYNTRYTLMAAYGSAEKADSILEPLMVKTATKESFKKNNTEISEVCKEHIFSHFGTYLTIHLKGMIRMLLDPGRFDVYSFFKLDKDDKSGLMEKSVSDSGHLMEYFKNQPPVLLVLLALVLLFNLLKVYAFGRFIFRSNIPVVLRIIVVLVLLYFTGLTGPLGASRFLLPVLPLMVVSVLFLQPRR